MTASTVLAPLGELSPDPSVPAWLVSRGIAVPYFDGIPIQFVVTGLEADPAPADFTAAVVSFLALPASRRREAAPHVYGYYRQIADALGSDVRVQIADPDEVWPFVTPTQIYVSRRDRRDRKVYVQVTAECEWEPDHGLQIVYRGGDTLVRVSAQDGHLTRADAYDLPESEDRIL